MGEGGTWRIEVAASHAVLATRARRATSAIDRMVGLLGRGTLPDGEGLIIETCRAIHTWFMRFAIDVVFVGRAWNVVAISPSVRPWRITPVAWDGQRVVELPAGTAARVNLRVGDRLIVEPAGG